MYFGVLRNCPYSGLIIVLIICVRFFRFNIFCRQAILIQERLTIILHICFSSCSGQISWISVPILVSEHGNFASNNLPKFVRSAGMLRGRKDRQSVLFVVAHSEYSAVTGTDQ